MLALLIRRFRLENDVSQPQMAQVLTARGWKMSGSRLSTLECNSEKGERRDWRDHQIQAVETATSYSHELCMFWAGRHPLDLLKFDPDEVADGDLKAGFAMLAMCMGKSDAGPRLTPELHERARIQFALGEPLTAAEIVKTHERHLTTELPFDPYRPTNAAHS